MTTLETLLNDLGIPEHIKPLSDWRDDLIRTHAAELQASITAKNAERDAAVKAAVDAIVPAPPVEISIRAWQAKAILQAKGILETAEQMLASMPDGMQKIALLSAWENNADFPRNSATIQALAAQIGLTDEQVDAMFAAGAALAV